MGIQHSNTTDLNKAKSLVELLAHSYLKPWSYKQLFVKSGDESRLVCDYLVVMDGVALVLFEESVTKAVSDNAEAKQLFTGLKDYLAKRINQRMKAAPKLLEGELYRDEAMTQPFDLAAELKIYYLGLSSLCFVQDARRMMVKHRFSSEQNPKILSQTTDSNPNKHMQLMSLLDLVMVVKRLTTMPDLANFLSYRDQLLGQAPVADNPVALMDQFISSGEAIKPARLIEENLVGSGLKPAIDPIFLVNNPEKLTRNFDKMVKNARFWEYIMNTYGNQMPKASLRDETSSYLRLLSALINESVVSRNAFVRIIAEYMSASQEVKDEGYLVNMRSYTQPERHYAFLFYALDPTSESHRSVAQHNLNRVAAGINHMVQDPPLNEIIVIGIADADGKLATDVFYTLGRALKPLDPTLKPARFEPSGHAQLDVKKQSDPLTSKSGLSGKTLSVTKAQVNHIQFGQPEPNRNALCPCGSGKRFRRCHGAFRHNQG